MPETNYQQNSNFWLHSIQHFQETFLDGFKIKIVLRWLKFKLNINLIAARQRGHPDNIHRHGLVIRWPSASGHVRHAISGTLRQPAEQPDVGPWPVSGVSLRAHAKQPIQWSHAAAAATPITATVTFAVASVRIVAELVHPFYEYWG